MKHSLANIAVCYLNKLINVLCNVEGTSVREQADLYQQFVVLARLAAVVV